MRKTFTLSKKLIPINLIVLILLTFVYQQTYSQQQFERVYANTAEKSNDEYLLLIKAGHVENQNNAVDGNTSTFARLNSTVVQLLTVKLGGEAVIRLRFTGPNKPLPNTPVTIKLGIGGNLLSVLGGLTIQATNGSGNARGDNNEVGPIYTGTSLVNLLSGKNQVEFTLTPTQAYDGVKIKLGNTGGLLSAGVLANLDVYHAYFLKAATNNIICESVVDSLYGSTGILAGGLNPLDNPSRAFDKNENTFATLRTNVSALNSTFLTGVYSSFSKPGDSIRLVLQQENTGLIDATLLSAIRVQTFNNNTPSENYTLNSPLLNLRLLGGTATNTYLLTLPTTLPFNRIRVSIGDGLVNALSGLRVYEINRTAPKPTITIPGLVNGSLTACQGAPINFTINPAESNVSYRWFDAAVNGNEITTDVSSNGTLFSPKNLSAGTYNYYVSVYRAGCSDAASERARVTLIITPGATAADINTSNAEICIGNTATIAAPTLANAGITNPVFRWYFNSDKTNPITNGVFEGATYVINPDLSLTVNQLTATRNFYVSVSGSDVCENPPGELKTVTVTVNNIQQPTLNISGNQTLGTGGSITLTATSLNASSFQWYKDGALITGAVNKDFTISNAVAGDAGEYTVVALGLGCSSAVSAIVKINIGGFGSTKSVSGLVDGKINAGEELTYTITVNNTGTTELIDVSIVDVIPAGTTYIEDATDGALFDELANKLTWTIDIPANNSRSVSFKVRVSDNLTDFPAIGNTATITNPNNPGSPQNPTVPPVPTNQIKNFKSGKSIDGLAAGDIVKAGDKLTYRIKVENTGNVPLTGVTITDPIPNGTTYVIGSADLTGGTFDTSTKSLLWNLAAIPYQGTVEVTFEVEVNANLTGIPSIGNTATITYPNNPETPQTPTDPPRDTYQRRSFQASKAITDGLNGNDKISPEAELTFAITVKNTGNVDINQITITDPIPAGTTYIDGTATSGGNLVNGILNWVIDLPFGSTEVVTFKVKVAKDLTGIPTIRNKATVTDTQNPTTPEEPESPPTDTEPIRRFISTKKVSGLNLNNKIEAGSELTYTISVTNNGNIDLNNVTIVDPIPAGTSYIDATANSGGTLTNNILNWTVNIPVDATINLTFKVKVAADLTNIPSIGNTAVVTDPEDPTNPQTPTDTPKDTEQTPAFSLTSSITSANSNGKVSAGEELTVSITVENKGNISLNNIVITNPLPANTVFKSTGNNGSYNSTTSTITFNLASISVNSSETFTFKLDAASDLTGITSISNTANVVANGLNQNTTASIDVCITTSVATVTTNGTNTCSTDVQITATSVGVTSTVYYLYLGNTLVESNNSGIFNLSLPPGTNNTYFVGLSGTGFCETLAADRKSVTVSVLPLLETPNVRFNSKTINSVTFNWDIVQDAVSYEYSSDGGTTWQSVGTATSYTFTGLKPAESVSISVRAIAVTACQNSAASAVITDNSDNPLGNEVFIPNTFTPNNDGNNDFFFVYGNTIKTINMRIYNQWGQSIFQSQQVTNGWNGTHKGQNQPTGVYVYSVELTFNDGSSTAKKGTITLIR